MSLDVQRPTLCLITDRQRLLMATGRSDDDWPTLLLAQVRGAIAGGVDVVQIREPEVPAGLLTVVLRQCVELAHATPTKVVVNDRLDVALAGRADGVHLPERGLPPPVVRRLTGQAIAIGRSIHGRDALAESDAVDYLIAGSVFESLSKPGVPCLGLEGFAAVVSAAGPCPVWAVGGVTADRIPALLTHGARGVAAIGAFIPSSRILNLEFDVQKITEKLRFAFDSSAGLS